MTDQTKEILQGLLRKEDNEAYERDMAGTIQRYGITEENRHPAKEIRAIGESILELSEKKGEVKGIIVNNREYAPNSKGMVTLPSEAQTVAIYADVDTTIPIVSIDGKVKVKVKAVSSQGGQYLYEAVTVRVLTAPLGSSDYEEKGSVTINSTTADSETYTEIDLTSFLSSGAQTVRLDATGKETGVSGRLVFTSITVSQLSLQFASKWDEAQEGSIKLAYFIEGAINKTLTIKIDGQTVYDGLAIGAGAYKEAPYNVPEITEARFLTHGVHTVEAWLSAKDSDKRTDSLINEIFVKTDETDEKPYMVVNNLATKAQPYVDTKMFEYCVFAPGEDTIPLIIRVLSADESVTYLYEDRGNVAVGEKAEYINSLDITDTATELTAHIYFYTKDAEGNEVALKSGYSMIQIDNSENFAPTPMRSDGFILNPKTRNNAQEDALTIINANTGAIVPSTFTGFDKINDGYIANVLRVPAGRKVTISYNPFTERSVTMEFDVRISNLRDHNAEAEPILQIGQTLSDGKILGWEMLPLRAYLLTQNKRSINVQDIQWQEDVRQHIAVNIVSNIGNTGKNYVRLFINSVMNREFTFENDDVFAGADTQIIIGSTSADIDIYGMKIDKQALSSQQVQQNYKSALPDAQQKVEYQRKNNILGDDNTIDFNKTREAGYNTLRLIADDTTKNLIPNYTNRGNNVTKGTVEMLVRNADGTYNYKYCQRITHCKQKGQGTSSMTYFLWNITWTATSDSERYVMNANGEWILDETVSGEDCYFLFPNGRSGKADIKGVKNVAKCNWASSMQSHKMGACNLYSDLYWQSVGKTGINKTEGYDNVRKSVTQLPFLFFVEGADGVKFSNLMTFGPAKFDKLCFGTKAPSDHYIKDGKKTSIFTVLEGSANGRPLPERKIPWLTDEVFYYLNRNNDDDPLNECLIYNGEAQFDVDKAVMQVFEKGTDNEYEIPCGFTPVSGNPTLWKETEDTEFDNTDIYKVKNGNTIKMFRRACNFVYLRASRLSFVGGTADTLKKRTDLDINTMYWVTQDGGENRKYDLFRWNPLTGTWVNAGATHGATADGYARLNLMEQCEGWFTQYNITYSANDPMSLNEAFIKARVQDYREKSALYQKEEDLDFDQCFRKLFALKDNWCKNVYEGLDTDGRIIMHSDDNDTMGDLDNVGASKTPYYAEEHDRCDANGDFDSEGTNTYWNSDTNNLWCLREQARPEELTNRLASMMDAMAAIEGSTEECMDKYFFSTQRYFPATAYNEQARLLYETAALALSRGEYTNAIDPLSQNLGDHLQAELEFWKKRLAYMASWCRSAEFANKSGAGTFSFRSGEQNAHYTFTVKAHQAIYPAVMVDGNIYAITKRRLLPGESVTLDTVSVGTQDITCFLCGIDYYASIGDLTGMAINSDVLNVSGKRLTEFKADGANGKFRPGGITFAAPKLQKVEVTNVASISGAPNLSECLNIEVIDLRGDDGVSNVILPKTNSMKVLRLPRNMQNLVIENNDSLEEFEVQGVEALRTVEITQSADIVAHEVYERIHESLTA